MYTPDSIIVEAGTILRTVVGSTAHGTAVNGTDDRDELGIVIEPPSRALGLHAFDVLVERTQPEGVRSGPGDLDRTSFSLRKWMRLALRGNPSVLLPLYTFDPHVLICTRVGLQLRDNWRWFASREGVRRYLGFMRAQYERLNGTRGQMRVNRPELVDRYGFDTKFAGHIIRLGMQGMEYAATGRVTLPMPAAQSDVVVRVRTGGYTLRDVNDLANDYLASLSVAERICDLPDHANERDADAWMVATYQAWWRDHSGLA